jgi:Glycosyl hydrolase family 26
VRPLHTTTHVRRRRFFPLALVTGITLAAAVPASACVEVGVYRDAPATLPALQKKVGPGVNMISTYVTIGRTVDPGVIALAKARKAKLMVTLMMDNGRSTTTQPLYSHARIAKGRYNVQVRNLGRQLKASKLNVILRPMPEANTQFWAWSGTVNGNTPQSYIAAWKQIRKIMKPAGGKKVKLLWAPYARSIPDTDDNAIDQYFPGDGFVDLVGVSGYNFGNVGELEWLTPTDIFQDPYIEIQNLSRKAFWIAETGSSTKGGNKALWIRELAKLGPSMPRLRGIVLYDVKEAQGDFRISATKPSAFATRALLATRCGAKKR